MPFYDLLCEGCGREFNAYATVTERKQKTIACPDCGGTGHKAILKDGAAIIVKNGKEEKCPTGACCPGCRHAH